MAEDNENTNENTDENEDSSSEGNFLSDMAKAIAAKMGMLIGLRPNTAMEGAVVVAENLSEDVIVGTKKSAYNYG